MKKLDLTNRRFGRLIALRPGNSYKRTSWICRCDCDQNTEIKTENLRSGSTKSCGCLNQETRQQRAKAMYSTNIKYSPKEASARKIWKRYQDGLSFDDFLKLSQKDCYYCGAAPSNMCNAAKSDLKSSKYAKTNGDFYYNGMDRIDSNLDHSKKNVVPCCKYCNYAKRERTIEEFYNWVSKVYEKNKKDD